MEDIMESCYLDPTHMCPYNFRCRICKIEEQHKREVAAA